MKRLILFLIIVNILLRVGVYGETSMEFGIPTNLGPAVNTASLDNAPTISPDGLELFFSSGRGGGMGGFDVWVVRRSAVSEPWGSPINLGAPVNSRFDDGTTSISSDGLTLYFSSNRSGGYGNWDLWVTTRETMSAPWGTAVNLGPKVNSVYDEIFPSVSNDGLELYFSDWQVVQPGGCGGADVRMARRSSVDAPWGEPNSLGPTINSAYYDAGPYITADGLSLYFSSERPGGYGLEDVWVANRPTTSDPWSAPVNLGPPVNSTSYDALVCISPDNSVLYFGSSRGGGQGDWDLWQVPVSYGPVCGDEDHPYPIGDLNMDCIVNMEDLAILCEHWLEDTYPDDNPFIYPDNCFDGTMLDGSC